MRGIENENIIVRKEREYEDKEEKIFDKNNKAFIIGKIEEKAVIESKKICEMRIRLKRKNGKIDYVPIVSPLSLMPDVGVGDYIEAAGEFQSYMHNGKKAIFLFARKITKSCEKIEETAIGDCNLVYISGQLSDMPYFKRLHNEEQTRAATFCLAVKREKASDDVIADYIHCVAWEDEAELMRYQKTRTNIDIYGKIHSRTFLKFSDEGEELGEVEVYEISVAKCEIVNK